MRVRQRGRVRSQRLRGQSAERTHRRKLVRLRSLHFVPGRRNTYHRGVARPDWQTASLQPRGGTALLRA